MIANNSQNNTEYPYEWRGRTRYADRQGKHCRMVELSTPGSFGMRAVVEFEDGVRVKATRLNVRRREGC